MTFTDYLIPLLDSFPRMDEIYFNHTGRASDGRFELRDIKGAMAKGIGWRHLYRVRDRLNKLAIIYEALVVKRVIE
jgi:hypothetical protein